MIAPRYHDDLLVVEELAHFAGFGFGVEGCCKVPRGLTLLVSPSGARLWSVAKP